jgi:hypothetical protein
MAWPVGLEQHGREQRRAHERQRGRLPPQRLHAHPQHVGVVAEYADHCGANTMSTAAHSTMATMADFMVNQKAFRTRSNRPAP